MELGDVCVSVVYNRIALSCKECSDEIMSWSPGESLDLDVIVSEAENSEHDCSDVDPIDLADEASGDMTPS